MYITQINIMSNDSRTAQSAQNATAALINKIVNLILSFVTRRLFIDFIGIEYLGINGLFTEILGMLSLADLGFGSAMAYSFYKPIAENDKEKITQLITFYRKVYNVIALAIAIVGIALVPFLDVIVNVDKEIPYLQVYYLVFLANTVVSYLFVYKSSIITASQKNYIVLKYQTWIIVAKVVLQLLAVVVTKNYLLYISVGIFTTLANNLLVSKKADELYPEIKERKELPKQEKKEIFSNLKSVFIYKISSTLLNSTDNTLMSMICGTVLVGYYANYRTITSNYNGFIAILFGSLTASIGNLVVKTSEKKRYEVFRVMQMVSFMIATFTIVEMYLLMEDFIVIWLGTDSYLLDKFTLVAILLNLYLGSTLQPLWSYREATGLYRRTRYIMLITAIENVILSVILGKFFGVGGIILATFVSKITTYVWYEPVVLFKEYFNESVLKYLWENVVNIILMLVCGAIAVLCTRQFTEISITNWIIKAFIGAVIVIIVYLIRYAKTNEFKILLQKLKITKQ